MSGRGRRKASVACRPKVAMQRWVLACVRAREEALASERMRERASAALVCAAAWAEWARERRDGSAMADSSGWVRAWEVDKAAARSGGVRKWLRRGGSGSGRARVSLFG